jgi:hypothetical protein
MEYRKIDAPLASALEDVQEPEKPDLTVFIQTTHPPGSEEARFLEQLGVRGVAGGRQFFTATLSPRAVAELSDQPWVRSLKLSSKLRPLEST